jgi:isoquinoline 1-oxidoreductase subunit beta
LKVMGVKKTIPIDPFKPPHAFQPLGGVAVVADNTWSAFKGRKQLKIDWDNGANANYSSSDYKKQLQETARQAGKVVHSVGDPDAEIAKAGKIIEAEYFAPHLAHASMEPPAAVADVQGDKVTVREEVAKALGVEKRGCGLPCNVPRRRIRPQIETRLRGRSGCAGKEDRKTCQGGVEPRG